MIELNEGSTFWITAFFLKRNMSLRPAVRTILDKEREKNSFWDEFQTLESQHCILCRKCETKTSCSVRLTLGNGRNNEAQSKMMLLASKIMVLLLEIDRKCGKRLRQGNKRGLVFVTNRQEWVFSPKIS